MMKLFGIYALARLHKFELYSFTVLTGGWTVSELELFNVFLETGIKIFAFITSAVLLLIALQKHKKILRENMELSQRIKYKNPDGEGGDGEDGSSGANPPGNPPKGGG